MFNVWEYAWSNRKLTINYTHKMKKKKLKTKLQIQEGKKNTRFEVVDVPPMFHLLHKQRGEEVLSKGGESKLKQTNNKTCKYETRQVETGKVFENVTMAKTNESK